MRKQFIALLNTFPTLEQLYAFRDSIEESPEHKDDGELIAEVIDVLVAYEAGNTFKAFMDSKRPTDDIGAELGEDAAMGVPGYIVGDVYFLYQDETTLIGRDDYPKETAAAELYLYSITQ